MADVWLIGSSLLFPPIADESELLLKQSSATLTDRGRM